MVMDLITFKGQTVQTLVLRSLRPEVYLAASLLGDGRVKRLGRSGSSGQVLAAGSQPNGSQRPWEVEAGYKLGRWGSLAQKGPEVILAGSWYKNVWQPEKRTHRMNWSFSVCGRLKVNSRDTRPKGKQRLSREQRLTQEDKAWPAAEYTVYR